MAPTNRSLDTSERSWAPCHWTGDAKMRQPWWAKLGKRLFEEDKRFESHIKYGVHIDKGSRGVHRPSSS